MEEEIKKNTDDLVSNRSKFDTFAYVSVEEALNEVNKRQQNKEITKYLNKLVPEGVPEIMMGKRVVVMFRHVATTNYEIARFYELASQFDGYLPIILEYTKDKFLSRNEWKHSLGKLCFNLGPNKNGEHITESHTIINFNDSDNKKISEIMTVWNEGLVDFHHRLFKNTYPSQIKNVYDLSDWLLTVEGGARNYYKRFLAFFLKDAVLFENFLLEKNEKNFTKEVIIPSILEIVSESGVKPLIVALEPTETESDAYWLSHPHEDKGFIRN